MFIRINKYVYISLEALKTIVFGIGGGVDGAVLKLDDGERIPISLPEDLERLKFFLEEVFSSSVIDLEKVYEKKDEILAAKQIMKDKIEELRAKAEAEQSVVQPPAAGLFVPQGPGNQIVRGSDGKPLKNLFVMPPRNKKGGPNGPTNAA